MHCFSQRIGVLKATRDSVKDCVATCEVLETGESGRPYEGEEEGNA